MKLSLPMRILALSAVICLLATTALMVYIFFQSPLLITVWFVLTCLSMYGFWLIFSGSEQRLWAGYLLTASASFGWAVVFFSLLAKLTGTGLVLAIAALSAAYVLIMYILRKRYKALRQDYILNRLPRPSFKKPVLIINPKSGNGRAMKAGVKEEAQALGINVIMLKKGSNIEKLASQAITEGCDIIGISGGDGSIGAVAKVSIKHNMPLVVLAGGTRCHFARDIGLTPARIVEGLGGFGGIERKIDVGEINGRIFLNNVSLGLYADIVDNPDYRENKVTTTRSVLQEHISGSKKPYSLQFSHGTKKYSTAIQILIGVNAYSTRSLFEIGQREKMAGGILQINVLQRLSDRLIRRLITRLTLNRTRAITDLPEVEQWQTKQFTIGSNAKRIVAGVDGEREEYETPVAIRVLPQALRLYVPRGGTMSRQRKSFSIPVLKQLLLAVRGKPFTID